MPAISPTRLRKDISGLFEQIDDPVVFVSALGHLLDFYADRTIRPSRSGAPASLMPAYHVPKPVLRELETEMAEYALRAPAPAQQLAERLWELSWFENKYLALQLLANVPEEHRTLVLPLLVAWVDTLDEDTLLAEIYRITGEMNFSAALALAEDQLGKRDERNITRALRGLVALAATVPESVLPALYTVFGRLIGDPTLVSRSGLLVLARRLAARSPAETAYFLRQHYLDTLQPAIGRLLRQCLPLFPESVQADLRDTLRLGRG